MHMSLCTNLTKNIPPPNDYPLVTIDFSSVLLIFLFVPCLFCVHTAVVTVVFTRYVLICDKASPSHHLLPYPFIDYRKLINYSANFPTLAQKRTYRFWLELHDTYSAYVKHYDFNSLIWRRHPNL